MKTARILIADDKEENLYLLRALLQGHGFEVLEACHGAEALERARLNPPNLIIADILMPVMDGFALCREWKRDATLKMIPFIFYTATYTHDSDREFALGLGAERFIVKPEEPDTLLTIIRETLQQNGKKSLATNGPADDTPTPRLIGKTPEQDGSCFLKQYNTALVRKLESKMEQLERANRKLKLELIERERGEAERKKLQEQLTQAQKLDSIGRLAGGVAHDFNNMLHVILGFAEMALDKIDSANPLHADLVEIQNAAKRSTSLTRQLLTFARRQPCVAEVIDLNVTIKGMLKMLRSLIGEDVDLSWRAQAGLWPVEMDPSQFDQILINLCVNARQAIAGVGKVAIETCNAVLDEAHCAAFQEAAPGDYVLLTVSDNGCGMGKDVLDHLFEPFFTTKGGCNNTGLGLATVYGIVKQNNGLIKAYSEPSKGTTFKIHLPRYTGELLQQKKFAPAPPARQGHETILLVEDEPAILVMLKKILERLDYRVLTAERPEEAMRLAEKHTGKIQLLITDLVMPEMNGLDLAQQLSALNRGLKCLFMSGYTTTFIPQQGLPIPSGNFLQKPFSGKDLANKVQAVLESQTEPVFRADI